MPSEKGECIPLELYAQTDHLLPDLLLLLKVPALHCRQTRISQNGSRRESQSGHPRNVWQRR
jgi:hypothetical protein